MQIDFSQAVTAEAKAQAAAFERATAIRTECRARILGVGSETTQMNIAQAGILFSTAILNGAVRVDALALAGLIEGDQERAVAWTAWRKAMQAECRRAIEDGDVPVWPDVPTGVAEFAARH
ncbi:MAG: hypothetical protein VR71_10510 [Roseovarius sp. BRH_c41]|uniref:hypothetical protein n=1 Tax=Roseovarius sp. BRH_c41 TaxID=1629709 RepID=UPI0005F1ABCA|nr:hypothetical protein [Roseovarius sp. BRH_c41]KJS43404.1 MAG: hypothetical protein VR71_10510 [Roseovarius sp. BRH_c41]